MKFARLFGSLLAVSLLLTAGCAGKDSESATVEAQPAAVSATEASAPTGAPDSEFEDYGDEQMDAAWDPLEPWNRFWFRFNDVMILKILKPAYAGYEAVTPDLMRTGLSNFWHNIESPYRMLSRMLQGEFGMAGVEFGRFMANTMAGFGGLIDVAAKDKPLVPFMEEGADLNQAFAVWGVPEGPYLVWPLFGPNTLRSTAGLAGQYGTSPWLWGVEPVGPVNFWVGLGSNSLLRFNDMGRLIDTYEALTKSAVEPYSAMRDAYLKYQRAQTAKLKNQ